MSELLPVAGLDAFPVEVLPVDGVDVPVDVFPDDELPLDDEDGFTPVEDCFPVLPVPVADELPPVDGVDVNPDDLAKIKAAHAFSGTAKANTEINLYYDVAQAAAQPAK